MGACDANPRAAIERVLDEYAAAYAARDMDRLQSVWSMPRAEGSLVRRLLAGADRVDVDLDVGATHVRNGSAQVEFEQALEYSGPAGSGYERSRLRASLTRGDEGSWKIVDLAHLDGDSNGEGERWGSPTVPAQIRIAAARATGGSIGTGSPGAPQVGVAPGTVRGLPRTEPEEESAAVAYRDAFESRDSERLGSVWRMTPVEKLLVERAWAGCSDLSLQVEVDSDTAVLSERGDRASIDFDQTILLHCSRRESKNRSRLRATLERAPSGRWEIVRMSPREAALTTARPLEPGAPTASPGAEALSVLQEYEAALEACDLTALSRIWILTPLERQYLDGVCRRYDHLSVAISGQQVAMAGDRARIDFVQDVGFPDASGLRRTRSDLTALMIRRSGGEWAIWKIREAD
jgi:hypothetical protein